MKCNRIRVFNGCSLRGIVWISKRRKSQTSPSCFKSNSSPTFFLFSFHYILFIPPSSHQTLPIPVFLNALFSLFPSPHFSLRWGLSAGPYIWQCTMDSTHSHTVYPVCDIVFTNGGLGMRVMEDGVGWALLSPSDWLYKTLDEEFERVGFKPNAVPRN